MQKILNPSPALRLALGSPTVHWQQTCHSDTCSHASHDAGYSYIEVEVPADLQIWETAGSPSGWGTSRLMSERSFFQQLRDEMDSYVDQNLESGWKVVRKGWGNTGMTFRNLFLTRRTAERVAWIHSVTLYDWHMAPAGWDVLNPEGEVVAFFPTLTEGQILELAAKTFAEEVR